MKKRDVEPVAIGSAVALIAILGVVVVQSCVRHSADSIAAAALYAQPFGDDRCAKALHVTVHIPEHGGVPAQDVRTAGTMWVQCEKPPSSARSTLVEREPATEAQGHTSIRYTTGSSSR